MSFNIKLKDAYLFFWNALPEGNLKNQLRCAIYNIFGDKDIYSSFNGKYFTFDVLGVEVKSYDWEAYSHFAPALKGYLRKYKIKKDDVVVDAGATVGLFTVFASKIVGDKGHVIAFEPDFEYQRKIKKNLELNNVKNVILLAKGMWNKEDVLEFNNSHRGDSSFVFDKDSYEIGETSRYNKLEVTKVPVIPLDKVLKQHNIKKVNFIKMDIEGAEMNAIEGAKNILKACPVNLAIASYHIVDGKQTATILPGIFKKLGYSADVEYSEHLTTYAYKI